jgi:V8-like Glu-specific endopeptidase
MTRIATIALAIALIGCGTTHDPYPEVGSVCEKIINGVQSTDARATVNVFSCTGTLIAPDAVLTAAHCAERDHVILADGRMVEIVEATPHPDYVGAADWYLNDLMILRLAYAVDLPTAPLGIAELGPAIVQGYGETEHGTAGELREGLTNIEAFTTTHRVVTDETGADSCYGDSGGPLYQDGALVGVVSTGVGTSRECGHGAIYTSPVAYTDWFDALGVEYTIAGEGC